MEQLQSKLIISTSKRIATCAQQLEENFIGDTLDFVDNLMVLTKELSKAEKQYLNTHSKTVPGSSAGILASEEELSVLFGSSPTIENDVENLDYAEAIDEQALNDANVGASSQVDTASTLLNFQSHATDDSTPQTSASRDRLFGADQSYHHQSNDFPGSAGTRSIRKKHACQSGCGKSLSKVDCSFCRPPATGEFICLYCVSEKILKQTSQTKLP